MPLPGGKENIGSNIETEESHGKKHSQAVAIALDVARRSGAKIPGAKKSEAVQKRAAELVKSGCTPARAMEKAEAEELGKGVLGPSGMKVTGGNAIAGKDRTQASPGNPGAKMTIASAFPEAPKPPMPKAQKAEYAPDMVKRAAELVKSGMCPGKAVKKARQEHGMPDDAKMKTAPAEKMTISVKKTDGGMMGSGMGDAGPAPGGAAGSY